jgi:spore coat protein U-like protein
MNVQRSAQARLPAFPAARTAAGCCARLRGTVLAAGMALVGVGLVGVAQAGSATATALAFPAYVPGGGAMTQTSTVSVKCTKSSAYTVALNGGNTAGGTVAQRLMGSGANTLQYNLYTTTAHTVVWGDGTGSSVTQPGTYTDTITVTVSY